MIGLLAALVTVLWLALRKGWIARCMRWCGCFCNPKKSPQAQQTMVPTRDAVSISKDSPAPKIHFVQVAASAQYAHKWQNAAAARNTRGASPIGPPPNEVLVTHQNSGQPPDICPIREKTASVPPKEMVWPDPSKQSAAMMYECSPLGMGVVIPSTRERVMWNNPLAGFDGYEEEEEDGPEDGGDNYREDDDDGSGDEGGEGDSGSAEDKETQHATAGVVMVNSGA